MKSNRGVTLIELIVTMAIFTIIVGVALYLLSRTTQETSQESFKTRTEFGQGLIAESIITRDIAMAGMGIPIEYNGQFLPLNSNNNTGLNSSDILTIRGATISSGLDDYHKWAYNTKPISQDDRQIHISALPEDSSYIQEAQDASGDTTEAKKTQDFFTLGWKSGRSNYKHPFERNDRIVFLNAEDKSALSNKIYKVTSVTNDTISIDSPVDFSVKEKGALIFCIGGLSVSNITDYRSKPMGYKLDTSPSSSPFCAPGTYTLFRIYGYKNDHKENKMPIVDCVLDFQVQFGLLDQVHHPINWVNDISSYIDTPQQLKDQLKLVKVFITKQYGKRSGSYIYPTNSITTADNTITLTSEQRHYHWQTITLEIPLRELE